MEFDSPTSENCPVDLFKYKHSIQFGINVQSYQKISSFSRILNAGQVQFLLIVTETTQLVVYFLYEEKISTFLNLFQTYVLSFYTAGWYKL